ncbi:DUF192 domain-containing protein [Nannocystaceae bacterium ST9]
MKLAAALALALAGCEVGETCEEDSRAQRLDEHARVLVGELEIVAELADQAHERERGWMHRRCDLDALLLVADEPASELAIWGCALAVPLDVWFVAEGRVIEHAELEPCAEPCGACPLLGEGSKVDAVLEAPRGELAIAVGDAIDYQPDLTADRG